MEFSQRTNVRGDEGDDDLDAVALMLRYGALWGLKWCVVGVVWLVVVWLG